MTRIILCTAFFGAALGLAACGDTTGERAATGGLGGLAVAGPVGAAAGATVGAATTN